MQSMIVTHSDHFLLICMGHVSPPLLKDPSTLGPGAVSAKRFVISA